MGLQKGSSSTATSAKTDRSWILAAALSKAATIGYPRKTVLLRGVQATILDMSRCQASRARRTE
jgi:hypothetical protein